MHIDVVEVCTIAYDGFMRVTATFVSVANLHTTSICMSFDKHIDVVRAWYVFYVLCARQINVDVCCKHTRALAVVVSVGSTIRVRAIVSSDGNGIGHFGTTPTLYVLFSISTSSRESRYLIYKPLR